MTRLRTLWRRIQSRVRAFLALRAGTWLYERGELLKAADALHDCVAHGGSSFKAHLLLGKIWLRVGRFERAREEFARARFLDPARFAAHGLPEDVLIEMAQRYVRPRRQLAPDTPGAAMTYADGGYAGAVPTHDDFSSAEERRRFRALPPISADDVRNVDWRDASELFDD
jgi:tetratricopeptide (TPR) repeat protein